MANEIDPQQIDDLNKNLSDLVNALSKTSATDKARENPFSASGGLGDLMGMSKKTSGTLGALGTSANGLTQALYKGEKGAQVFTNAIEALSVAIMLIPGLGAAAKIASLALYAMAKSAGAVTKQADALYKSYQDLAQTGATAANGINGVFDNMQNFGYGIEELDKMVRLVAENSQTLAKFSLTAADGTSTFASAMTGLVRDQGLKELGKTPDAINAAGAAFIRQSTRAGISQRDIGDQLSSQTKKYIMDLDRLQRLTGTSADALQKQQDEAMAEDAYNDVVSELRSRATAGDNIAKEQLMKIMTVDASLSDEMRKEFRRSIGGDISAGQRLFYRYPTLLQNIQDETVGLGQTMNDAKIDVDNYVKTFGVNYRLNSEGMREFGGALYTAREESLQFADYESRIDSIKKQITVTDKATKNLAAIDLANMNSRDALQSFVQLGVEPATNALRELSNIARGGAQMMPGQGTGASNSWSKNLENLNNVNKSLLNIISQGESRGNYNALVYGKKGANTPAEADLTNMTIAEVMEYQKDMLAKGHASTAVGAYQMIAKTLAEQVKKAGLDPNTTKFDQKTQDMLAEQLVRQAGYGRLDPATVMKNLSGTWASLPKNMSGGGSYDGVNGNQATVDPKLLYDTISKRDSTWTLGNLKQLIIGIYGDPNGRNNITGPTNSYDAKMNGVNPDKTLPAKDTSTPPQEQQNKTQSDEILDVIRGALTSLDRRMADVADNTKKTATYAGN